MNCRLALRGLCLCLSFATIGCSDETQGVERSRHLLQAGNCPTFTPNQACACSDRDFQGQCVLLDSTKHFYPSAAQIGIPNDWISSIAAGDNVNVRYCADDGMAGACSTLYGAPGGARLAVMSGNPGNDSVSAIRVDKKTDNCQQPADNQVAIFTDGSFGGDCAVLTLPAGADNAGYPHYLGTSDSQGIGGSFGVPQGWISSLKVGSAVRVVLFNVSNYSVPLPLLQPYLRQSLYEPGSYPALGLNANDTASSIIILPTHDSRVAFRYGSTQPSNATPVWQEDAQGLAHDDAHWYVTNKWNIYKYGLLDDLASAVPTQRNMGSYPRLSQAGCRHFGDPDVVYWGGVPYLLVPIEQCTLNGAETTLLGVFETSTLNLICADQLYLQTTNAAFVAANPLDQHILYVPGAQLQSTWPNLLFKYYANSERLTACDLDLCAQEAPYGVFDHCLLTDGPDGGVQQLQQVSAIRGGGPADIGQPQGGVFSPDGRLFYLTNGGNYSLPYGGLDGDGLHVFDATTSPWRHVARATNDFGYFYYTYDQSTLVGQEPEGLDYIDMTNRGGAMSGKLHAMMYENVGGEVFIKHYDTE